ncbi:MAG: hypothetical protein KF760_17675 [Candidatus Eremiobacteraeota bacterium]|nr:hypothetical protein [Candidatus Eremiobacteraeota bacterium]MCW5867935.1 hypothetical protein [Candidatus Eremiobacteraeota bacterium]
MLEQFFAAQSDPSQSPLTQKLRKTLDEHFVEGAVELADLLYALQSECMIVQEAMEEPPDGKAGEHYVRALQLYLEALCKVGRELEATGELSEETEKEACELTGQADRSFNDFEFEASQIKEAESEA